MHTLECLKPRFSLCRLRDARDARLDGEFCFFSRTDQELSLVCPEEYAPENALARDDGWRGFRVQGCLDFSLIGVLARISAVLAEEGISIFAISTYDTDYVLTREADFPRALQALSHAGYAVKDE